MIEEILGFPFADGSLPAVSDWVVAAGTGTWLVASEVLQTPTSNSPQTVKVLFDPGFVPSRIQFSYEAQVTQVFGVSAALDVQLIGMLNDNNVKFQITGGTTIGGTLSLSWQATTFDSFESGSAIVPAATWLPVAVDWEAGVATVTFNGVLLATLSSDPFDRSDLAAWIQSTKVSGSTTRWKVRNMVAIVTG